MAKTSSIHKNIHRRNKADKYRARREALKSVIMSRDLPADERFAATLKLAALPRNSARIRVRNRCELTGRPRGFYRKFKLSRIALRELASKGMIPGVTKASW